MEIKKTINETCCDIRLIGSLDTLTAPQLDAEFAELGEDIREINLDMEDLKYISSAGLRSLLVEQKKMMAVEGTMVLKNVRPEIYDILEITGFVEILTIE